MNNDFNNQTPPEDGQRPDYSYNWNGSEHNNNKKGKGKLVALLAIIVALVAVISVVVLVTTQQHVGSDDKSHGDVSITDKNEASPDEPSKKPSHPKPDFAPSTDSDVDLSTAFTEIYENCSPSCCTIRVSVRGSLYSLGSGFVIDAENGYIATNHHVIEDGDKYEVAFYNGEEYTAQVIGSDSVTDIAVLKIDAENLVEVEFGDSGNIKVGENVVAIGTPYDESLAGTMTSGIVSGLARGIDVTNDYGKVIKTMTLIQTDCSINPGNSGGPLFDMAGNVIGITSLKIVDEQFEGIGFAIPITDAIEIFNKLISGEDIDGSNIATAAPRIGVTVYDLEYGLEYFRMNPRCEYPQGILVGSIEYDTAAYIAGLSAGDIITQFAGETVESLDDLDAALAKYRAGDEVTIKVFRFNRRLTDGEYVDITFKLDAAQ